MAGTCKNKVLKIDVYMHFITQRTSHDAPGYAPENAQEFRKASLFSVGSDSQDAHCSFYITPDMPSHTPLCRDHLLTRSHVQFWNPLTRVSTASKQSPAPATAPLQLQHQPAPLRPNALSRRDPRLQHHTSTPLATIHEGPAVHTVTTVTAASPPAALVPSPPALSPGACDPELLPGPKWPRGIPCASNAHPSS